MTGALTPTQKKVVEKIKQGWTLYSLGDCNMTAALHKGDSLDFEWYNDFPVLHGTVIALLRKKMICPDHSKRVDHWIGTYKLVENDG